MPKPILNKHIKIKKASKRRLGFLAHEMWRRLDDAQAQEVVAAYARMLKSEDIARVRREEQIRADAVQLERLAAWEAVNAILPEGPVSGNGYDQLAQRNGVVLACTVLHARAFQDIAPTPSPTKAEA